MKKKKPKKSSDSSMDDCNAIAGQLVLVVAKVQIPLWTIVTLLFSILFSVASSSDSSMDDCNARPRSRDKRDPDQFRFLYGRL